MPRLLPVCALLALLPLATGCAAVVAGAAGYGAYKYAGNNSQRAYAADGETTWLAAVDAMREAGYPMDPEAPYTNSTVTVGDARVRVQTASDGVTHVLVRVGTFDNQSNRDKARRILDGIDARLAPAAEPTPTEPPPVS